MCILSERKTWQISLHGDQNQGIYEDIVHGRLRVYWAAARVLMTMF